MVELLWNSGHEESHRGLEWLVVPSDSHVHLETVEAPQNPEAKADRAGAAGMGSM